MNWIIVTSFLFFIIGINNADIDLQNIEIPDIDDIPIVKERCESKGGKGAYENFKEGKTKLKQCMQGFIDIEVVKKEVEEAKKTGSMDEVFGKYCAKRPIVRQCLTNFTEVVTPCLDDSEKQALNLTLDILKQLGEFICYRDGDRIAMFVAEGGVECIKENMEGVKNCVNTTLKIGANNNEAPSFLMDKKKCDDLGKLQTCVVTELEKCKDSTPANIVNALFRFIKKSACTNKSKRSVFVHKMVKRSTSILDQHHTKVMKIVEERCKESSGESAFRCFMNATETTKKCLITASRRVKMFISPVEEYLDTFLNCSEPMVVAGKACLRPEEQYFPDFYRDFFISLLRFSYENYKNFKSMAFRGGELMQCLSNLSAANARNEIPKADLEISLDTIITKEKICETMETLKNSVIQQTDKYCNFKGPMLEIRQGLTEAIVAPCQKTIQM